MTLAEEHLHDHFPGFPVMPGSLMLEGMAQTGGILLGQTSDFNEIVILAKVPNVTFHSWACPGDTLTYTATLLDVRPEGGVVECKAHVGERLVAEAEIVFAHLDRADGGGIGGHRPEELRLLDGPLGNPRRGPRRRRSVRGRLIATQHKPRMAASAVSHAERGKRLIRINKRRRCGTHCYPPVERALHAAVLDENRCPVIVLKLARHRLSLTGVPSPFIVLLRFFFPESRRIHYTREPTSAGGTGTFVRPLARVKG